jgi:DNA end-binding protein Ku
MASWKGAISFGLVSVPITLEPATEEQRVPMHQAHVRDSGRVRLKRWCELEDKEVPFSEIAKQYEAEDGRTVIVTDDDLAQLPVPTKKTVDVLGFVDQAEIDPVYFGKPYYVRPDKAAATKAYVLLRDALAESGRAAVTKITLSTRESPAVLRVHDGTMILQLIAWPAEVRSAHGAAPGDAGVRPQELAMARSLVESMTASFDELAADLHDAYQDAVRELVKAKLEGVEPPHEAPPRPAGDNVVDLMAVLERSIKAAQGGQGGQDEAKKSTAPAKKAVADKSAAKKGAAKKTAAGKTAAKKTTTARRRAS